MFVYVSLAQACTNVTDKSLEINLEDNNCSQRLFIAILFFINLCKLGGYAKTEFESP